MLDLCSLVTEEKKKKNEFICKFCALKKMGIFFAAFPPLLDLQQALQQAQSAI